MAPALWNRWPEAISANHLSNHLRRRGDIVAEAAGLDRAQVAAWVVVRETVEVLDVSKNADAADDWRDMSLTIAEAFLPRLLS